MTTPASVRTRCMTVVFWFDINMSTRCVRIQQHEGLHRDGLRWFDDDGIQQPGETDVDYGRQYEPRPDRLTRDHVLEIRRRYQAGDKVGAIARDLRIEYQTAYACARGTTYRSVA
jgi:hypothetical protein